MNSIFIPKKDYDLIKNKSIISIYDFITIEEAISNNKFNITFEEIDDFVIFTTDDEYYHIYIRSPKDSSPIYKLIEHSNKMKALFKYVRRKETLEKLNI